jgi:hypothetical protein
MKNSVVSEAVCDLARAYARAAVDRFVAERTNPAPHFVFTVQRRQFANGRRLKVITFGWQEAA